MSLSDALGTNSNLAAQKTNSINISFEHLFKMRGGGCFIDAFRFYMLFILDGGSTL